MDSVESQFLEARKRKRAKDTLVEHHTETRVDLAEGDRDRIAQLEARVAALESAVQEFPAMCASIMDLVHTVMQLADGQQRLKTSVGHTLNAVREIGRGAA